VIEGPTSTVFDQGKPAALQKALLLMLLAPGADQPLADLRHR
jgi:hypothetical protein